MENRPSILYSLDLVTQLPRDAIIKGCTGNMIGKGGNGQHLHGCRRLSTLKAKFAGASSAVSRALAAFVESELGREGLAADRVVMDYARLIAELRRLQGLNPEMAFAREAATRLARAGAPKLAARVRTLPSPVNGEDTAIPSGWLSACTVSSRYAFPWARVICGWRSSATAMSFTDRSAGRGIWRASECWSASAGHSGAALPRPGSCGSRKCSPS